MVERQLNCRRNIMAIDWPSEEHRRSVLAPAGTAVSGRMTGHRTDGR